MGVVDEFNATYPGVRILIVCAKDEEKLAVEAMQAGAHGAVVKPLTIEAVRKKVDIVLGRGGAAPLIQLNIRLSGDWPMALVTFYEKPGCGTNRKQKAMLAEAGHALDERNLLTEPWTAERLLRLFRRHAGRELVQSGGAADQIRRDRSCGARRRRGAGADAGRSAADPPPADRGGWTTLRRLRQRAGFVPARTKRRSRKRRRAARARRRPPCPAPTAAQERAAAPRRPMPNWPRLSRADQTSLQAAMPAGPETLDWDLQPNPFREFAGCARTPDLAHRLARFAPGMRPARRPPH